MALNDLLLSVPAEFAASRRPVLARWTETPAHGDWEAAPDYGAYVDDRGLVVEGAARPRAVLHNDNPQSLVIDPATAARWGEHTLVFLDWGSQSLSWDEIFDLWEVWDYQNMIADCGAVAVAWPLRHRWKQAGWVAFLGDFDGAPLDTLTVRSARTAAQPVAPAAPEGVRTSFLALARRYRQGAPAAPAAPRVRGGDPLPMLPFTLEALKDPGHRWPEGVPVGQP